MLSEIDDHIEHKHFATFMNNFPSLCVYGPLPLSISVYSPPVSASNPFHDGDLIASSTEINSSQLPSVQMVKKQNKTNPSTLCC